MAVTILLGRSAMSSLVVLLGLCGSMDAFVFPTERPVDDDGMQVVIPKGTQATCKALADCPTLQTLMKANERGLEEFERCGSRISDNVQLYKCPDNLQVNKDDECKCLPITKCPILFRLVRNKEFEALEQHRDCGFQDKVPKYCCPQLTKRSHSEAKVVVQRGDDNDNDKDLVPKENDDDEEEGEEEEEEEERSELVCGFQPGLKIVGGSDADDHEFPWAVALDYFDPMQAESHFYLCGGSLINKQWIVTAAHCVTDTGDLALRRVRLGHAQLDHQDAFDLDIDKVVVHPAYNSRGFFDNDIALIKLLSPVDVSVKVRPICLPKAPRTSSQLEPLSVAGWGLTNTTTLEAADRLQFLDLEVVDNLECTNSYTRLVSHFTASSDTICAIGVEEDSDSCKGDSGGPLMLLNEQSAMELVGIVSFGGKKCDSSIPGVYTRIASFLEWIKDTVNNN